jgi:hypothetical protein
MPKTKPAKLPKWANAPLKFAFNPDAALAKGALKPRKSRPKRK